MSGGGGCGLSYPSATKILPLEATATDVGLQKWVASFPGTNISPSTAIIISTFQGREENSELT